ncbi:hypothetical protein ABZV77_26035 [Streptomyces sp. NPDC004732]|uniref:hypothetical protein n=1 Tax=Streptomyces sp. NPDC004732 TaxID=3154290 RepID=UPI0033AEDDEB
MRRGVRNVLGASAAALCLGGLLSACGNSGGGGYVATGAAGAAPERAPGKTVGPSGDVKLVPLDKGGDGASPSGKGDSASGAPSGDSSSSAASRGAGGSEGKSPAADGSSGSSAPSGDGSSSGDGPDSGRTDGGSGSPSAPGTGSPGTQDPKPDPKPPSGPAALSVGDPERKPADKRWCEKVTVAFRNTGGSPVRSGTVTFGTHIIGALGVDWATIESTVKLPAPLAPGQKKEKTWPVCVDAWRVPLGMHVETRDVAVKWR